MAYGVAYAVAYADAYGVAYAVAYTVAYTGARKDPTSKQKFDGLCPISLEPLVLQISYIPHWKALIFSFLEV